MAEATALAKKAADTALLQAQSIKGSERARIFFSVAYERMDRVEPNGSVPKVKITAINHGKTTATITKIKAHLFAHPSVPTELPKLPVLPQPLLDGKYDWVWSEAEKQGIRLMISGFFYCASN